MKKEILNGWKGRYNKRFDNKQRRGGATLQGFIDRVFRGMQRLNAAIDLELRGVDCKYKINYNSSMKNYSKEKRAFTLAEVLITLGIIGVVAALTIPTLLSNYQKKEFAARLVKTYSTLAQAAQRAQVDYGDVSTWGYQSNYGSTIPVDEFVNGGQERLYTTYARKYFIPYLRVIKDYGFGRISDIGYESWKLKNGNYFWQAPSDYAYRIELSNGVGVFFSFNYGRIEGDDANLKISSPNIFVDVNGKSGPNIMGRDIYLFTLTSTTNKFEPYGSSFETEVLERGCGYSPTTIYGSYYCAALLQRMGWKITDAYPW